MMHKIQLGRLKLFILIMAFAVSSVLLISCNDKTSTEPDLTEPNQQTTVLNKSNPQIKALMMVQSRHTAELMKIHNVVGTAIGLTDDGKPAILVLTKSDIKGHALAKGLPSPIPAFIENVPVKELVTGEIHIFKGKPGGGSSVDHKAIQTPPIQLGTSGGWRYDLANGYCCGGTLGSLVTNGTKQYVLSNYHVLYSDIVAGGNNRVATAGDPVIQPGLIDISCNANDGQDVAKLISNGGTLPNSNVDAGIAEVISGMVRTDGSILEIGVISSATVAAFIRQAVKKSGRTTGLTRSSIQGLNATVNVTYDNECAGTTAFTKTFTGQIVIKNNGSRFLNSGDSGSLMVEDVATNPRAIGLLFAGSNTTAIANPIDEVLAHYGSTFRMVGN